MGVIQWIFQRISNVLIIIFGLGLLLAVINNGGISEQMLTDAMASTGMRVYLMVTLVFAGINSLLAGWQIAGDYAEKFHLNRSLLTGVGGLVSAAYVVVGAGLLF